jgi:glycosyltransferase involved in cell wall biosynthesis
MAVMTDLSIVIPALNEAATVEGVIRGHAETARGLVGSFEIVCCDDGSTDGTSAALSAAAERCPELIVLSNGTNRGIPATMRRLYASARGEWVYFTPADGQVPASALSVMWAVRDGAALVVGRRIPRRDARSRILVAELYSAGLRALFQLPIRDVDSVKLYRASELRVVAPRSATNFMEAEILITMHRRGAVIREVPIEHRPRIAGQARGVTVGGAARTIVDLGLFTLADLIGGRRRPP